MILEIKKLDSLQMYYIYLNNYKEKENKNLTVAIWIFSIIRILLCLLPQNGWLTNSSIYSLGIIRNIPFVILGIIIAYLYYKKRNDDKTFKNIWLNIILSFIFYMIVVLGSSVVSILGIFMLPKTICNILIVLAFYNKIKT